MRILMLGWEFPPFKSGGLGTACFGLTRALDRAGHDVLFVLPRPVGDATAEHVTLLGPDAIRPVLTTPGPPAPSFYQPARPANAVDDPAALVEETDPPAGLRRTRLFEVESPLDHPYRPGERRSEDEVARIQRMMAELGKPGEMPEWAAGLSVSTAADILVALDALDEMGRPSDNTYTTDLFGDAERYAHIVAAMAQKIDFDVVHAHDWLAFRAGALVRQRTGKPFVAHVHATEFDRSGDHINQPVYDIERMGVHAADRVVAVSRLTGEILANRYAVDPSKVDIVYNGIDKDEDQPAPNARIVSEDKIVLFLGRLTLQKGPEYFIRAAKRALEKMDNIKFVVAGSGDMAIRMIEEAAALGIGHKVLFTGFLRGRDVDRVYRMADCYVMPSVSEPFGIVALEAIHHDVPTIISKQSGVSEVLSHALKVDFWDVDDIADKIVAVLRHPPLSQTLREHGPMEIRALTWADAARKVGDTYDRIVLETA